MAGRRSLFVPNDQYDREFLPLYARALDRGEKLFVIECRTEPLFRWHTDVDVLSARELDDSQIDALCLIVCRALLAVFSREGEPVLVCRTSPKQHKGSIKTGLHLVCPTINCDVEQALAVRARTLRLLEEEPTLSCENGWDDALDTSVYRGSGLRMVGSSKVDSCMCTIDQRAACEVCGGKGRRDGGRAYELHRVLSTSGEQLPTWLEKLRANRALLCIKASIRCLQSGGTLQMPTARRVIRPSSRRASSGSQQRTLGELCDDCPPEFQSMRIVDCTVVRGRTLVRVDGQYCQNVRRAHSSSGIYFVMCSSRLTQRCFCRKYGCPSYSGPTMALNWLGVRVLGSSSRKGLPPGFV